MGTSNSRKKLVSIEVLDKLTSTIENLEKIFETNNNGFISLGEFSRLLDFKSKFEIMKKLYSYFCFDKKYLNKDDLKYLYFVFTTEDTDIKINFIVDLIFKKSKKPFNRYQEKVYFYFSQKDVIHQILISDRIREMIDRSNFEISKENVRQYLHRNFKDTFRNFSFVRPFYKKDFRVGLNFEKILNLQSNGSLGSEKTFISSNDMNCKCFLLGKKKLSRSESTAQNANYSQTKNEFEILIERIKDNFTLIERKNDNLFTILILEKMMSEIDINIIIINIISSYLKKKTQKNFIDFQTLKYILCKIGLSYESRKAFLFEMLSFPKKTFSKDQISKLLSLIKNELSKEKFNDILISFSLESYNEEDYFSLIRENSFLIDMLNHLNKVNYIPYLFFNLPTNNLIMQRDCISILMNNEKNLKSHILNSLESEHEFYCVDISFWREWCVFCDWDFGLNSISIGHSLINFSEINNQNNNDNINNSNNFYNNKNLNNEIISNNTKNLSHDVTLEIHIDYISGITANSLRPGMEYLVDYVLLPKKVYNLFKLWYRKYGDEIIVRKINYTISEFKSAFQIDSELELQNDQNFSKMWPVIKYDSQKNTVNLIEVYPLNSRFFKYDEIISSLKVAVINLDAIKEILEKVINNPNSNIGRTIILSRKTNFTSIKNIIYDSGSLPSGSKQNSRIWIYHSGELNIITNENYILENFNIIEKFIIVVEIKVNNEWPSNSLFLNIEKYNNNKESNINIKNDSVGQKQNKNIYGKGIINIGNTCYMNSVLQILLNLDEIKTFLENKNFRYWVNRKNKYGYNGKIITSFLTLFNEYHIKNKESLKPHKFKAAIGDINSQFKNLDQQDSQEFLSYLVDVLHEELNIKSEKEYIPNPENFDGTEEQLSGEYWANNLRRNASFIHSLFLGQLKSTLTCGECFGKKITYETFTNLNIPIPQKKTILLNIIIHRIPFTYKAYYFEHYGKSHITKEGNSVENVDKNNNKENVKFNQTNELIMKMNKENELKMEEKKQKEYFDINFNPKKYLNAEDNLEKNMKEKENKYFLDINETNKLENKNVEYNLSNKSGLTVRDRLNFLRKESYEMVKLVSRNLSSGDGNELNNSDINKEKETEKLKYTENFSNESQNHISNLNTELTDNNCNVAEIEQPKNKDENRSKSSEFESSKNQSNNNNHSNPENSKKENNRNSISNSFSSLKEEKSYTSRLVTSIPIQISLEFDRKAKVKTIIEAVKNLKELELEKNDFYTNMLLIGYNLNFIDTELKIDDCFQNNQTIDIYEFLNSNGLNEIIWNSNNLKQIKQENESKTNSTLVLENDSKNKNHVKNSDGKENSKIHNSKNDRILITNATNTNKNSNINKLESICYETLKNFRMPILDYTLENKDKVFEYLVEINHRFITEKECYLFQQANFQLMHNFFFDALILNNSNKNINARFLYEYIWEKYEYMINNPLKIKNTCWWNYDDILEKNSIKYCSPFVIRILNRESNSCALCEWYKFCPGCVVNPFEDSNIIIKPSNIISVDWCYNIQRTELNTSNIRRILKHENSKNNGQENSQKTLQECMKYFLESEYLEGEDQKIYCSKCKDLRNFYKKYNFDRLPPILIISLKRFKFAKMYKVKLDNLIDFPIYDLDISDLSDTKLPQDIKHKYDLYGIINHNGYLSGGHYQSSIKNNNNSWINYDDSYLSYINENQLVSSNAYILVYRLKSKSDQLDYMNLINNISEALNNELAIFQEIKSQRIYMKNFFSNGEPVITSYGKGYVIEGNMNFKKDFNNILKVKLKSGVGYLK